MLRLQRPVQIRLWWQRWFWTDQALITREGGRRRRRHIGTTGGGLGVRRVRGRELPRGGLQPVRIMPQVTFCTIVPHLLLITTNHLVFF